MPIFSQGIVTPETKGENSILKDGNNVSEEQPSEITFFSPDKKRKKEMGFKTRQTSL